MQRVLCCWRSHVKGPWASGTNVVLVTRCLKFYQRWGSIKQGTAVLGHDLPMENNLNLNSSMQHKSTNLFIPRVPWGVFQIQIDVKHTLYKTVHCSSACIMEIIADLTGIMHTIHRIVHPPNAVGNIPNFSCQKVYIFFYLSSSLRVLSGLFQVSIVKEYTVHKIVQPPSVVGNLSYLDSYKYTICKTVQLPSTRMQTVLVSRVRSVMSVHRDVT